VSVAVKTTELTHVPKVESCLPSVRYVMEITQQIIVYVLFSKTCNNFEKKQLPSKRNINITEENTNCINPILNSTSHPNNSNNNQTYSQDTLQNKNPIHRNNEHQKPTKRKHDYPTDLLSK
jgi:hypothetical protein